LIIEYQYVRIYSLKYKGRGIYMNSNDKDELDDELIKSMKKLVEEETNVAKAFIDTQNELPDEDDESGDETMGKTRVIPKVTDDMLTKVSDATINISDLNADKKLQSNKEQNNIDDTSRVKEYNKVRESEPVTEYNMAEQQDKSSDAHMNNGNNEKDDSVQEKAKKPMDAKKKKMIIAVSCVVAALVVIIGIVVGVVLNNKNKNSYQYNYDKGMSSYQNKDYDDAIRYLTKASKLSDGRKNVDLKYTLYQCYAATDNTDMSTEVLKDILSFDENNEKALKALASIYNTKKDGTSLNKLIKDYKNKDGYRYLEDYIVETPKPSVEAGSYDDVIKLQFTENSSSTIYYTTDKTEPDKKSKRYTGTAIEIQSGTTTIKAIAISDIGVCSDVVELEYTVDFKKPSAPTVSPASGTYEEGQTVTIDNIPAGSTAYYTLDGSTPTKNSEEYSEPFTIPTGNNVISVVIIDSHNQSSSVVKRNYVVNKAKTYVYNEALEILKAKLISKGVLKSDGATAADGSTVTFVYQSRTTVDGVEMFVVRYDVTSKTGKTSTAGYYGVATKTGDCYTVTQNGGAYSAAAYN
jgi:tetratricopeptide (TPR) repeat protein